MSLTAHNWQNWKGVFPSGYCHEIYRVEAVVLKKIPTVLEKYNFSENVNFQTISWKIYILPITAKSLQFEFWEFFCTLVTPMMLLSCAQQILFLLDRLLAKCRFPFPDLRVFLAQNHLALLKDRFLKKMLLKRANTGHLFFTKL